MVVTFDNLSKKDGIFHATFTKAGGCSKAPFASLNVSFGVGDTSENVETNREIIRQHFGIKTLISARQIHDKQVAIITEPQKSYEIDGVDALICSVPGVAIMIQQADCQAILLYDPQQKVVAAIHSGWQGSVADIIGQTIRIMCMTFGTKPSDLIAGISPSLGPCCAEFIHFKTELPPEFHKFQVKRNHFDFWAISTEQLLNAGVSENNMEISGICTKCTDDFFSYRKNKQTGRFCSVIGLRHE